MVCIFGIDESIRPINGRPVASPMLVRHRALIRLCGMAMNIFPCLRVDEAKLVWRDSDYVSVFLVKFSYGAVCYAIPLGQGLWPV
jgi:hypothetical protein